MIWYLFILFVFDFVQIGEVSCQLQFPFDPTEQLQIPADLPVALDNIMQGDTHLFPSMSSVCSCVVSSQWTPDNHYEILLNNGINSLLNDRLIVGALTQIHYPGTVTLAFYDSNHNVLRGENGDLLEFMGSPDDLGHAFYSLPLGISYAFIKVLLVPNNAQRLNPNHIFFHLGYRLPSPRPRPSAEEGTIDSSEIEKDENQMQDIINDPPAINGLMNSTDAENTGSQELEDQDCSLSAWAQLDSASNNSTNTTSCNASNSTGIAHQSVTIIMIQAVWNTVAGSSCTMARPGIGQGKYLSRKPPVAVFDDNKETSYLSFGSCGGINSTGLNRCGLNTGFYFTISGSTRLLKNFMIRNGKRSIYRDPKKVTIEGSNGSLDDLCNGESWDLLYSGESGLKDTKRQKQWGVEKRLSGNSVEYSSYRFLVTEKRGLSPGVEYADVKFNFGRPRRW